MPGKRRLVRKANNQIGPVFPAAINNAPNLIRAKGGALF
jgi:hypothetical protein